MIRAAGAYAPLLLSLVGPAQGLSAQETEAFSWVRATLGASWMTPRFPPGDFWTPSAGPALRVETPFAPGVLAFGVHRHAAAPGRDVVESGVDRMDWTLLYMGWGGERPVGPVRMGVEGRIGSLVNAAPRDLPNAVERELVLGGAGWLRLPFGEAWSGRAELGLSRVYARRRWSPVSASAGIGRSIGVAGGLSAAARAAPPSVPALADSSAAAELSWWASFPDLPSMAFGSEGTSTDRVDRHESPGSLRGPEAGAPRVWLDGMPIAGTALGVPSWAWIPLGTPDLARIEGLDRAAVAGGRPELEGALVASSRVPGPGERLHLRVMSLNESGDPGPLRFTPLASPNVDGPLYEIDAAAGERWESGWVTASAVRRERWSVTRPELRERNRAFFREGSTGVRAEGASLALGQRIGSASVRTRLWGSRGDRYLRPPSIGAELAARVAHLLAGTSLTAPLSRRDSVRAYVVVSSWEMDSPSESAPPDDPRQIAWSERGLRAGGQLAAGRGAVRLTTGLDGSWTRHGRVDAEMDRASATAYATVMLPSGPWRWTLGAENGGETGGAGALLGVERSLGRGWIEGVVSWRSGGRDGPLALWDHAVRDPGILSVLGIEAGVVEERDPGRRVTARLAAGIRGGDAEGRVELFARDFAGERRPALGFVWDADAVVGRWGPLESGEGAVVGAAARVRASLGPAAQGRASVEVARPSGTRAFEDWWSGAPRVQAWIDARVRVRPGWWLRSTLRGRSGVRWAGFADLEDRGEVPGDGRLPASLLGDIRLEGAVFGGRLRVLVGLTNVLDQDARLHPLGAGESRGLLVGVGSSL